MHGPGRLLARIRAHPDATALLALALLPVVVLGRGLWPGHVLSPADLILRDGPWAALAPYADPSSRIFGDVAWLFHPWLIHAGRALARGELPLWNPYTFAGVPFLANPQTAVFFPPTWLAAVLPAAYAITLVAMVKIAAAGLSMYWLLRRLALLPLAAFVGATAFMLDGSLIAWLHWSNSTPGALLPALLAAVEGVRARPGLRPAALLGLVTALEILCGYPQGAALCLAVAGAWVLARARGAEGGAVGFVARAGLGVGLGGLIGAVQLLPFLEYLRESAVLADRAHAFPPLTVPWRAAIGFLMPYYFGSPGGRDWWGPINPNEIAVSVGLVPWIALPAALALAWRRTETRVLVVLAAVTGGAFYGVLPGLPLVVNTRLAPLLAFALAALGAIGCDAAARRPPEAVARGAWAIRLGTVALMLAGLASMLDDYNLLARGALRIPAALQYAAFVTMAALSALALLAWLRDETARARWGLALVALQLASTVPLAATYNPVTETRWLYPTPPVMRHLQERVTLDGSRVLLHHNLPMLWGLRDPSGYDGMVPRRVADLVGLGATGTLLTGTQGFAAGTVLRSPALPLFAARHVVLGPDAVSPLPGLEQQDYVARDARVFTILAALPRTFVVAGARCEDDGRALALIRDRVLDLRAEVLLADCPPGVGRPGAPAGGSAELVGDGSHRVVIRASTERPAYLVLLDTWFPGWQVRVDGQERPLLRANYAFRAVPLGPGTHEVEFRYRPGSFRLGLVLSLAGALALAGIALVGRRASRARTVAATLVAALALAAGVDSPAHAALPPSPVELTLSPGVPVAGQPASIGLHPTRSAAGQRPFDLYVIGYGAGSIISYLGADGAWWPEARPYRTALSLRDGAPVVVEWPRPGPAGYFLVALIAVRPEGDPASRAAWVAKPALRHVKIHAPPPATYGSRRWLVLGGLLLLTAGALATIMRWPRGRTRA